MVTKQYQTGLSKLSVLYATWLAFSCSSCRHNVEALATPSAGGEDIHEMKTTSKSPITGKESRISSYQYLTSTYPFCVTPVVAAAVIPFFRQRRLDDCWDYDCYYEDDEETRSWFLISLVMFAAMIFGIFVFGVVVAWIMLGPLNKEYTSQGKTIVGLVTGAKKKVRQDFHATTTPGMFYGSTTHGTVTETTTNRILNVEYPIVVNGERKIVRKVFRQLHKKTFDRPNETFEVELYLLPKRGMLSAYPRDEFHLSKADKCKETFLGIFSLIMFMALLVFGARVAAPWYLFMAVVLVDIAFAIGICIHVRNFMLSGGKMLRFVPGEAGERPFNFDVYEHDETEIHYDEEDGCYHPRKAEVLKSVSPAASGEQAEIPFARAVPNPQQHPAPKPASQKMMHSKNGTHSPCQSPKKPTSERKKKTRSTNNGKDSSTCQSIPKNATNSLTQQKVVKDDAASTLPASPPIKPAPDDVCFGSESHPGTIAWRKVVEEIMDEYADDEFGPPIHRAIKKRLKNNARFWAKGKYGEEEWKVASKGEVVRRFRAAFEDTKKISTVKEDADTLPLPPPPTKPVPDDVCFGSESHPGTMAWRKVVEEIMDEHADDEFGPPIYRAIKNRLKNNAHFWVKTKHGEEWKVAPLGEVVRQFRVAFDAEQNRFFETAAHEESFVLDDASF